MQKSKEFYDPSILKGPYEIEVKYEELFNEL